MPSYVVGLDIGRTVIKAAVLRGGLRGYEIEDFLSLEIADGPAPTDTQPMILISPADEADASGALGGGDDPDDALDSPVGSQPGLPVPAPPLRQVDPRLAEAIGEILRTVDQPQAIVVASAPSSRASSWLIDLPFTDPKRIEQTIEFEVENYVPWDLEDVVLDFEVLGPHEDGARLLVAMVPRERVSDRLQLLQEAGADPKHLSIDALELARLVPASEEAFAIIDISDDRTLICVAQDGKARWIRSMDGGMDLFPELPEPESLVDDVPAAPVPVAFLSRLRATLLAAEESGAPEIDAVFLCGEGSEYPALAEAMQADLGIDVEALILPPSPQNPESAPRPEPEHAVAYALALRGFARKGRDGVTLDFRRDEFAWRADSRLYTRLAFGAVAAVLLFVLFFAGKHVLELRNLTNRLEAARSQIVSTVQGEFPEVSAASLGTAEQAVAVMQEQVTSVQGRVDALSGYSVTPLIALKEISDAVPKSIVVDLNEFLVNEEMIRLRGTTDSFGSVDQLEARIKGRPLFEAAEKSDVNKARDGKMNFVLKAPREPQVTEEG